MAVIATLKLDDEISFGNAPCQPDGTHGGFRAARNEAHFLDERNRFGDQRGELQFQFSGDAETCAAPSLLRNGRADGGMRVTEQHRAPRTDVIKELVAVRIVKILAASLFDDQRLAADGTKRPDGAINAANEDFLRLFKNFARTAAFGFLLGLCWTPL